MTLKDMNDAEFVLNLMAEDLNKKSDDELFEYAERIRAVKLDKLDNDAFKKYHQQVAIINKRRNPKSIKSTEQRAKESLEVSEHKKRIQAEQAEIEANIIQKIKSEYNPEFTYKGKAHDEITADFASFEIRDKTIIDTVLAIKISTLVNGGEAPFLQLNIPSGTGKSFTFRVISAMLGTIPVATPKGMIHVKSVAKSTGTPLSLIYSKDPQDIADGLIWAFDDSTASEQLVNFLLQITNFRFMEDVVYKNVKDGKTDTHPCPKNLRIFVAYAVLKDVWLRAGMLTRIISGDITPMSPKERSIALFTNDSDIRIDEMTEKWSKFWEPLYTAVYFKGKRSKVVFPNEIKSGEICFDDDNRDIEHIKCLATAYAVMKNPTAIIEGTDVSVTVNEVMEAKDLIDSTKEVEDDYLMGHYKPNTVTYKIAKHCDEYLRNSNITTYTTADLTDMIVDWLKETKYECNSRYRETARNGVNSFIHQETKHGRLITYTEHGSNRKTYGYRKWDNEILRKAESNLVSDKLAEKHSELKKD